LVGVPAVKLCPGVQDNLFTALKPYNHGKIVLNVLLRFNLNPGRPFIFRQDPKQRSVLFAGHTYQYIANASCSMEHGKSDARAGVPWAMAVDA
jgi:hypothetical protein